MQIVETRAFLFSPPEMNKKTDPSCQDRGERCWRTLFKKMSRRPKLAKESLAACSKLRRLFFHVTDFNQAFVSFQPFRRDSSV